jgi:alpha-tubulin suppressor-like RCC1 family protein
MVGWYDGDSWCPAGKAWLDRSGACNHVVDISGVVAVSPSGINSRSYVSGSFSTGLLWPASILPQTFTLFHVTRYDASPNGRRGRIFQGLSNNWLSGHWGFTGVPMSGVAFHDTVFATNQTNLHGAEWVVSAHRNADYRSQGVSRTVTSASSTARLCINRSAVYPTEVSDWAVAEVLVYNRNLSDAEVAAVEAYLDAKYNALSVFPPCPLVASASGFATLSSEGYGNGLYLATSSSQASTPSGPWAAFDQNDATFWQSASVYSASGAYLGSQSPGQSLGYSGEWLRIDLPCGFTLGSHSIVPAPTDPSGAPSAFRVFGSSDGGVSWTVVDDRSGLTLTGSGGWTTSNGPGRLTFSPSPVSVPFQSYALVVGSVQPSVSGTRPASLSWSLTAGTDPTYYPSAGTQNTNTVIGSRSGAWSSALDASASWIWSSPDAQTSAVAGTFVVQASLVNSTGAPVQALLSYLVSDPLGSIALNSKIVAPAPTSSTSTVQTLSLTLSRGSNLLEFTIIKASAGAAGLIFVATRNPDGALISNSDPGSQLLPYVSFTTPTPTPTPTPPPTPTPSPTPTPVLPLPRSIPYGLTGRVYNGYFADDVTFFSQNPVDSSETATNFTNINTATGGLIPLDGSRDNYSVEWIGKFQSTASGAYTFYTSSDEASYLWLGITALTGYTTTNALVKNGSLHGLAEVGAQISLAANTMYDIRIQYGDQASADNLIVSFTLPGSSTRIYDGAGYYFTAMTYGIPATSWSSSSDTAVIINGSLLMTGVDASGQLGNNSTVDSATPVNVSAFGSLVGTTVSAVSAGAGSVLALDLSGGVHSWGNNASGQLGNNSTSPSLVPVAIGAFGSLAGFTVVSVSSGSSHSVALDGFGHVHTWGGNEGGQLGNNSTVRSLIPINVSTFGSLAGKTVKALCCATFVTVALDVSGQVHTWGDNSKGQLGNNSTLPSLVPLNISSLASGSLFGKTVVSIFGGQTHLGAVDSSGQVHTWGANTNGQLGNNSSTRSLVPINVSSFGSLVGRTLFAVRGGGSHTVAFDSLGQVHIWGANESGQLGNSGTAPSLLPINVSAFGSLVGTTVVAVNAGSYHTVALDSAGTVHTWGSNANGQMGNGSTVTALVPIVGNNWIFPTVSSGLVGFFDGNSWDASANVWNDRSGKANHATVYRGTIARKTVSVSSGTMQYLSGGTSDGIQFPVACMAAAANYTMMAIARYNGTNRQRIFNGNGGINGGSNYLSGFRGGCAGVAYRGDSPSALWMTQNSVDVHGNDWVVMSDQARLFRSQFVQRGVLAPSTTVTPTSQMTVNYGSIGGVAGEYSDWAVVAVLFFDRVLTVDELVTNEQWLYTRYVAVAPPVSTGLVGYFDGFSWDASANVWNDRSAKLNHATVYRGAIQTTTISTATAEFRKYLSGGITAGIQFPVACLAASGNYTMMAVARYNGTNRQRIFDGSGGANGGSNYQSGFQAGHAGVAYRGDSPSAGWMTQSSADVHGNDWVVMSDQARLFRSQFVQRGAIALATPVYPTSQLTINYGSTTEYSDWAVAAVLFFNRILTSTELAANERWLYDTYVAGAPVLDFDANSITSAVGSAITTWTNAGSLGGSATGINSPILRNGGGTSRYAEFISSSSQYFSLPVFSTGLFAGMTVICAAAFTGSSANSNEHVFGFGTTGAGNELHFARQGATNGLAMDTYNYIGMDAYICTTYNTPTNLITDSGVHVYAIQYFVSATSTRIRLCIDGSSNSVYDASTSAILSTRTLSNSNLGCNVSLGQFLQGSIARLQWYNYVLPDTIVLEKMRAVTNQLASFTNFTAIPLGMQGRSGPAANTYNTVLYNQCAATYVTVSGGLQYITVPTTGTYTLIVAGAAGGASNASAGKGIIVRAVTTLTAGTVLKVLVGQAGMNNLGNLAGTGGGGTFVVNNGSGTLMYAAGGGGGGGNNAGGASFANAAGVDAVITTSGTADSSALFAGGTNGSGGTCATQDGNGAAGGGFIGNGAGYVGGSGAVAVYGGGSFGSGGLGALSNIASSEGGFGGGGGAWNCGGGGGGYSGGAGGGNYALSVRTTGGGGGGSFGITPLTLATFYGSSGYNTGDGFVSLIRGNYTSLPVLDTLSQTTQSQAVAMYGFKSYSTKYTGPVVTVRRGTDNATVNFYASETGILGTASLGTGTALSAWLGGAAGYITALYDQTGRGKHLTQATAASQPQIVQSGAETWAYMTSTLNLAGPNVFDTSTIRVMHMVFACKEVTRVSNLLVSLNGHDVAGETRCMMHCPYADGVWYFDSPDSGNSRAVSTAGITSVGQKCVVSAYKSWTTDSGGWVDECNGFRINSGTRYWSQPDSTVLYGDANVSNGIMINGEPTAPANHCFYGIAVFSSQIPESDETILEQTMFNTDGFAHLAPPTMPTLTPAPLPSAPKPWWVCSIQ